MSACDGSRMRDVAEMLIGAAGLTLIICSVGWGAGIGVFLCMLGNNIGEKRRVASYLQDRRATDER